MVDLEAYIKRTRDGLADSAANGWAIADSWNDTLAVVRECDRENAVLFAKMALAEPEGGGASLVALLTRNEKIWRELADTLKELRMELVRLGSEAKNV